MPNSLSFRSLPAIPSPVATCLSSQSCSIHWGLSRTWLHFLSSLTAIAWCQKPVETLLVGMWWPYTPGKQVVHLQYPSCTTLQCPQFYPQTCNRLSAESCPWPVFSFPRDITTTLHRTQLPLFLSAPLVATHIDYSHYPFCLVFPSLILMLRLLTACLQVPSSTLFTGHCNSWFRPRIPGTSIPTSPLNSLPYCNLIQDSVFPPHPNSLWIPPLGVSRIPLACYWSISQPFLLADTCHTLAQLPPMQ